jgi:DNA-binding MarR family transcriptional regulator
MPEWMLDQTARKFPGDFDRHALIAMFALRAIARRYSDRSDARLARLGINAAKHNYLTVIYMSPEQQLTLSEISTLIHTSNATVTSMVAALEEDGYVKRVPNREDGRSAYVRITAKGRSIVERSVPMQHTLTEAALHDLDTEERAELARLLIKVGAGMDRLEEERDDTTATDRGRARRR